ncbi:MAG: ABC-type transport auxiliary lipoprotein family protein, partial [Xanthobacteraceae bacterium]
RVDSILTENSDSLKGTLSNFSTFSDALARNSNRIDGIVAGLERMTGGATATAPRYMFDLTAPRTFPAITKKHDKQLVIADPTSVLMYESRKITIAPAADDVAFGNTQWSDNLPKLVQAKLVQSFENANSFAAIARPNDDLTADYKLLVDIRSFQISTAASTADIEIAAKIADKSGKVIGTRIFQVTLPIKTIDPPAAFAGLDAAFGKIATDLVTWAANTI